MMMADHKTNQDDYGAKYMPNERVLAKRIEKIRARKIAAKRAQRWDHDRGDSGIRIIPMPILHRKGRSV